MSDLFLNYSQLALSGDPGIIYECRIGSTTDSSALANTRRNAYCNFGSSDVLINLSGVGCAAQRHTVFFFLFFSFHNLGQRQEKKNRKEAWRTKIGQNDASQPGIPQRARGPSEMQPPPALFAGSGRWR